ncbi:MAG: UMP kinase [Candidatus Pacearchaeota archaeon]|nr:UMP kinase [Candidatus Pacearchaeota archaeon]
MKEVKVISLGGSLIVPEKIDLKFLKEFRQVINKNRSRYKFIIVCGGGTTARKYISAIEGLGLNEKFQDFAGISATRMNARFISYLFGVNPENGIPHTLKEVESLIKRQSIVICGALEYKPRETSDATSAEIAKHFHADFINLTNVSGLHDKNPKRFRDAKFIPRISWEGLYTMANKLDFRPGQHFVIDQTASRVIMENRIKTYIIGKNMKNLDNLLNNRKFTGTIVEG